MKREQNYVVVVGTNLDHRTVLPTPVSVRTWYSEVPNLRVPSQWYQTMCDACVEESGQSYGGTDCERSRHGAGVR